MAFKGTVPLLRRMYQGDVIEVSSSIFDDKLVISAPCMDLTNPNYTTYYIQFMWWTLDQYLIPRSASQDDFIAVGAMSDATHGIAIQDAAADDEVNYLKI